MVKQKILERACFVITDYDACVFAVLCIILLSYILRFQNYYYITIQLLEELEQNILISLWQTASYVGNEFNSCFIVHFMNYQFSFPSAWHEPFKSHPFILSYTI